MGINMDFSLIWKEYGLDELERGITMLFPKSEIDLNALLSLLVEGDIWGAVETLFAGSIGAFAAQVNGMRGVLVWLLVLGLVSSLVTHFVEIFDRNHVADISFYFMYLLFIVILLKCFSMAAETARETMENILLFVKMLVPAYLLALGLSAGAVTAAASYQVMLLVVYGVEYVLSAGILPLISGYVMLAMVNGIWFEEKLSLLLELLKKVVSLVLKGAFGVVTGISLFQSLIAPVVDSARSSALQKVISMIPGVGAAAGGVTELVLGSAVIIRNSIGVVLLLLLLLLCVLPLFKIAVIAGVLKGAAAFMGVVSDKRITACTDQVGDAGLMLLRTAGTAMLLFLVVIAITTAMGKRVV